MTVTVKRFLSSSCANADSSDDVVATTVCALDLPNVYTTNHAIVKGAATFQNMTEERAVCGKTQFVALMV